MPRPCSMRYLLRGLLFLASFSSRAIADDILSSSGFTNCLNNATIKVNSANVQFDRASGNVTFDVSGTSTQVQKVKAALVVTAYGNQVFEKDFDPCDDSTKVDQLCPVPAGTFAAKGSQVIPSEFISQIPSIAFSIPDLDGEATLRLTAVDGGENLACIQSGVSNGKTLEVPAVSYVAVGIAGGALLLTGLSALGSAGTVGGHTASPSFGTVLGWFQSMAMNGMLSVNYPPVYRSFTKNFGFAGLLIPWTSMQTSIDNFRASTGGNLIENGVQALQNATLVFDDGSSNTTSLTRRSLGSSKINYKLSIRDFTTQVNGTSSDTTTSKLTRIVHGIQAYVEELSIPQTNTFMTVLMILAIIVAAIAVGILFFKVILEVWALLASFPKRLTSFRKRYWRLMANTITNLILLLYGIWTLYCVFQFTHGDSWAASVLAGVTLGIFTAVLGFFTIRIFLIARKYKKAEGDASALYENKETWLKYSLFYDSYKKAHWWLFLPAIVYMFAKGCIIAAGDGHGLVQTSGQMIVEVLMLLLLLFLRPFASTASNWINIIIQFVRVLSVVCILVFVEQLGIAQTTKTITGLVLIVVQASLTGILALLIVVNAIITCCKENPHRKRRKEAGLSSQQSRMDYGFANKVEKLNRDLDHLTPLDARNSFLMGPREPMDSSTGYIMGPYKSKQSYAPIPKAHGRWDSQDSTDDLVGSAAGMGLRDRSASRGPGEHNHTSLTGLTPTVPDIGYHGASGRQAL